MQVVLGWSGWAEANGLVFGSFIHKCDVVETISVSLRMVDLVSTLYDMYISSSLVWVETGWAFC